MKQHFLVVLTAQVVDQPFVPAQEAVLDEDGNEITPAVPEQPLVTHDEIDQVYVEEDAATVAKVMAMQADDPEYRPNMTFYRIKFNNNLRPAIKRVRERGRAAAPARTMVTIEDQDGEELGAAEIG